MENILLGFLFASACNVLDRLEALPDWDDAQSHAIVATHRFLQACPNLDSQ